MKESEEIMRLDTLEPDEVARIMEVKTKENLRRRLSRQGVSEGNFIRVISCMDPIVVEADKNVTAISRGIAENIKVINQRHEKGYRVMQMKNNVCPVERAGRLDIRIRKLLQNPKKILGNYIKKGMTVLDVGCGTGFFSVEMAKMLGNPGKVIAADLQEGMLKKLKNKIKGTEIEKKIRLHKCQEDKIGISEKVDFALAFYMVHEVPDQKIFFEEIKSILKPNGKFLIVEPKYFHVSKRDFERMVKNAMDIGFKPVEKPRVFLGRAIVLCRPPF